MYGNSHATLCVTRFDVGGKQKNQKKKRERRQTYMLDVLKMWVANISFANKNKKKRKRREKVRVNTSEQIRTSL